MSPGDTHPSLKYESHLKPGDLVVRTVKWINDGIDIDAIGIILAIYDAGNVVVVMWTSKSTYRLKTHSIYTLKCIVD